MLKNCTTQRRLPNLGKASFFIDNLKMNPLEAQLLASRGASGLTKPLIELLGTDLKDLKRGASRVWAAIETKEQLVVVADYDCDGATACAVMVSGLRALGADIHYVVPDRLVHGYGISPSVVDLARDRYPLATVLVTVDNGILGHSGIDYAQSLGMDVVVTDHHLQGSSIPDAIAVINPSRLDCSSGLQQLAGVGVALFLVCAVKRLKTAAGHTASGLNFLLPYVAVGTVADMVSLGEENRQLVSLGLDRMRLGQAPVGLIALMAEAGCTPAYMTTQDIGFGLGPRINAAGRLESMELGIELLLETDSKKAGILARMLSDTNIERKKLQLAATEDASFTVDYAITDDERAIVLGRDSWHPGIVGLVASRLKDTHNLPTFIFSLQGGVAKGSGRSIPGFQLKDALEEVARRAPGVLSKFGGHAMAAGATLTSPAALETFKLVFTEVACERLELHMLSRTLLSDGPMPLMLDTPLAARIMRHPWGQGFEAPAFDDSAVITDVRALGKDGKHWKIQANVAGQSEKTTIVLFNAPEPAAKQEVQLYLQPGLNTWKDTTNLQWLGRVLR